MLRFWIMVSLLLTAVFTGIGLLIARQGIESASGLYVIYRHPGLADYLIADSTGSAQGSGLNQALVWSKEPISVVACSADGQRFAFLTESAHLYVFTAAGLLYDKVIPIAGFAGSVSVADDGSVGLTDYNRNSWFADPTQFRPLLPPLIAHVRYGVVHVSARGLALWETDANEVIVASIADSKLVDILPNVQEVSWLGTEQMLVYRYSLDGTNSNNPYGHALFDLEKRYTFRLNDPNLFSQYSPTGKEAVVGTFGAVTNPDKALVIFDPITSRPIRQVKDDPSFGYLPMCFLAFRPQMLIAGS